MQLPSGGAIYSALIAFHSWLTLNRFFSSITSSMEAQELRDYPRANTLGG